MLAHSGIDILYLLIDKTPSILTAVAAVFAALMSLLARLKGLENGRKIDENTQITKRTEHNTNGINAVLTQKAADSNARADVSDAKAETATEAMQAMSRNQPGESINGK